MTDQQQKAKSFFIKLLIACLGFIIADKGIGSLMHHFYGRIHHGEQGRLTYTIDSTDQSMLIIGSSRAAHHYVSAIISNNLHLSCYNAGKDKQGLFYNLAILKMVLHRYCPHYLILDLSPVSFATGEESLDELSVLLPYYSQHPEIKEILEKRSKWEWLKLSSSLYKHNSLLLQIAFNNLSKGNDSGIVGGYIPNLFTMAKPYIQPFSPEQVAGSPDSAIVGAFEELVNMTRQAGCQLTIVASPLFLPLQEESSTLLLAGQICRQQNIPFFDYTRSPAFIGNETYFSNEAHLNNAGAAVFSQLLCIDLKAKYHL